MTEMTKEIKEILARVNAAVKELENIEDSNIDIFEDLGVLISDVAQILFAKTNKSKELEKKDAINSIVTVLSKVVNL